MDLWPQPWSRTAAHQRRQCSNAVPQLTGDLVQSGLVYAGQPVAALVSQQAKI
jgi:hypothetical protein